MTAMPFPRHFYQHVTTDISTVPLQLFSITVSL